MTFHPVTVLQTPEDGIPVTFELTDAAAIVEAAETIFKSLSEGRTIDATVLRSAMTAAFGSTDADGAWVWKDAYEALEVAQVLFLRRYLPAMLKRARYAGQVLPMLEKLADLTPTHTKRTEESVELQQFSTPLALAFVAAVAAAITPDDLVLEPSAGTGLLAVKAEARGASLMLNELGDTRYGILKRLFPAAPLTSFNAEQIHDRLDEAMTPTVVLMNPPFSTSPNVQGREAGIDLRHLRSALAHLQPGGRLVAITSVGLTPSNMEHAAAFARLAETATLLLTVPLPGSFFKKHGTSIETRLTVFDKAPTPAGHQPHLCSQPLNAEALLMQVTALLPVRQQVVVHHHRPAVRQVTNSDGVSERILASPPAVRSQNSASFGLAGRGSPPPSPQTVADSHAQAGMLATDAVELTYEIIEEPRATSSLDGLYLPYAPERIRIPNAKPHPDKLVQSAAMSSVAPPIPTYRPHLPKGLVESGVLSAAQLESVIYAGESHSKHLAGHWRVNETFDVLNASLPSPGAVQFRRGWFLGDGTGAGKGRQVAGIILDNWLKGRRKAVWISKSDKLLEDAQRDWSALGQEKLLVVPQDRFKQGRPIKLPQGILFTTYATLRSESEGKRSRLQQILDWTGPDFDGVIIFDEAHAMGNAAGSTTDRGDQKGSMQGIAGLKLQNALPDARVVYVSATGATTVQNLAYAQRLGLWGSDDLPFETREAFVTAMLEGGIASAEVLARDLKSLGLYMARSLSYEGVEVEILEHPLTAPQIHIYDSYATAYQIIHTNLDHALEATNITGEKGKAKNKWAKSAAKSAFFSNQQRFFNHLITAMKVPTLIRSIQADLDNGDACVVQLVSTSEALMERRLADVPPSEWNDLSFDVTPREYVLDYLKHSFPTTLFENYTDDDGNECSRPVTDDKGNFIPCKEAIRLRDDMIENLCALPPVQSALDQLIHHFGPDMVAEVTGRSRRIVKRKTARGNALAVQNRSVNANLGETQAFMDDVKRILVFSDAGGTGRSYHADLGCKNQRKRIHYLLEAGWKADAAIQGLGRSNRTNQKQPPLFRPVATDVRGEKRFLSTIARRLDSLGAITRGERKTGGQGLFRPSDNLESRYARDALRHFFKLIHEGKIACCSYRQFMDVTGLTLHNEDLALRSELPPISTFLNRVLALQINLQNALFEEFEALVASRVDDAIAAGTYEVGLETLTAESMSISRRKVIALNTGSGAATELVEIKTRERNTPRVVADLMEHLEKPGVMMLVNKRSHNVALQVPTSSLTSEDGSVQQRVKLVRPMETQTVPASMMKDTFWEPCSFDTFSRHWDHEVSQVPTYRDSSFHMLTGLLLPIWKRLPRDNPRVYRLTTDEGVGLVGRYIPPELVQQFDEGSMKLPTPAEAWQRLEDGGSVILTPLMRLRTVTVMRHRRIELEGFDAEALPKLKALGLISEIISWKTRLFVPVGEDGPQIIARLLSKYSLAPVAA